MDPEPVAAELIDRDKRPERVMFELGCDHQNRLAKRYAVVGTGEGSQREFNQKANSFALLADILMRDWGINVKPVNYSAQLAAALHPGPLHSDADIDHLMTALTTLCKQCARARAVA
ncbi:hypothetical protein RA2_02761 [Roseovarius sp. A-2]|uniref:hypothetical protein n=1 Tax=Roseovarius sp. A-2 TaxID=1570360 RepID=UPI0009D1E489|nr:hypothetical protein [Roseovarius sp. A-2]GAW35694.1 hypothetical protein RA2_02761 [Roseovarius sp. A-2]